MKLFCFSGVETDWVAANDEAEAHEVLMREYGISEEDVAGSYEDVFEVDPDNSFFEADQGGLVKASVLMAAKPAAHVVASITDEIE